MNCYRVRVDRANDSRFERTMMLAFLDREEGAVPLASATGDEMKYLHQHVFWTMDFLTQADLGQLPDRGDELWVYLDPADIIMVAK